MLVGMGWSEGKGLGREENGRSEHLTIPRRQDNSGIGCNSVDPAIDRVGFINLDDILKNISNRIELSCEDECRSGSVPQKKLNKKSKAQKSRHSSRSPRGLRAERKSPRKPRNITGSPEESKTKKKVAGESSDFNQSPGVYYVPRAVMHRKNFIRFRRKVFEDESSLASAFGHPPQDT